MKRRSSQELAAVRQRVEHWRAGGGGRGSRIPEELWSAAVDVARDVGLWATSRALRFNYERLRDRAQSARRSQEPPAVVRSSAPPPGLVALDLGAPCRAGRVVVDLVGRGGEQMRVDITGIDVVALAQTFWGRQS